MPPTIEFSRDERPTVAHDHSHSVLPDGPPAFSDAQMRELDRRIAEDDADPDGGIPWEEVQARTHARLHPESDSE